MKRKCLILAVIYWLLIAIVASMAQVNIIPLKNKTQSTPTPSSTKQTTNCEMPRLLLSQEMTPAPSPEPTVKRGRFQRDRRTPEQLKAIAKQLDWDCDGVSNFDDNCLAIPNSDQRDRNKNGTGDACEQKRRRNKRRPK